MKALITGATSGLGYEMAIYLDKLGWELVLTGRDSKRLEELQAKLLSPSQSIILNLAEEKAPYQLYEFCKDKNIDFLINNAGLGVFGEFANTSLDDEINLINVNIKALHILTKLFLRDFQKKNQGRILNIASSAGFMSGPLFASYYASKNYTLRLSLAIYEELHKEKSNVKISIFCPGPIKTEFNKKLNITFSEKPISAKYAAEYAINSALKNKTIIVPTFKMKLGVFSNRIIPEKLMLKIVYNIQHKKLNSKKKDL